MDKNATLVWTAFVLIAGLVVLSLINTVGAYNQKWIDKSYTSFIINYHGPADKIPFNCQQGMIK